MDGIPISRSLKDIENEIVVRKKNIVLVSRAQGIQFQKNLCPVKI